MQGVFNFARRVAFVALVVRALVPVGWMPDAHGLTICPGGMSMQAMPIDHAGAAMHHENMDMAMDGMAMDAMPMEHDGDGKAPTPYGHHDICPFAAAPHLAAMPDLPQLALPAVHAFAAATDQGYATSIWARFTPQSPRGPPLKA